MIVTRLSIVAGIIVFAFLCWMAIEGVADARNLVITVVALFLLIAGGNALRGRSSYGEGQHAAPRPTGSPAPPGPPPADDGGEDAGPAAP